jgi:serine/threonine protein phosphatase PrpC
VNARLDLHCPACGDAALADDEYCESCGTVIDEGHGAGQDHAELDRGVVAAVTDRGLVHDRNEDAFLIDAATGRVVAVVCDGVSSSAAPHVAARVAADALGRTLVRAVDAGDAATVVARALTVADDDVRQVPWMVVPGRDAPSCTAAVATWDGTTVTIGWAGDSRVYWIDGGGARRLTNDHSWAQDEIDAGRMSVVAAEADARAHVITRWLGDESPIVSPAVTTFRPDGCGRLVVCTDGLWNLVPTTWELAGAVAELDGRPAIDVARALTARALAAGGHDNITVAVIDIEPTGPPTGGGGEPA